MPNELTGQIQHKIDHKTKPLGALGQLESVAAKICQIQHTLEPTLSNPYIIVFAGDHGIAKEGVSAYPQDVTFQMVLNFLNGGAAINVFAKQNGIGLIIVDAGVNHNFPSGTDLVDAKAGMGTQSFLSTQAMSSKELEWCLQKGSDIVIEKVPKQCNVIGFGEMGIGNSSAAAVLMAYVCGYNLEDCVGRGTGVNDEQLNNKLTILKQAQSFHGPIEDPKTMLQTFGGFEMTQMCGAMLTAYEQNKLILVDGFIATSVFLIAHQLNPAIINNALFCHLSDESGHQKMLQFLGVQPILQLQMRLGEGTGCAVAYPILESAVRFINEMASFDSAGVSNKE